MNKSIIMPAIVACIVMLSGCASIVSGSNQSISVATTGCPGATCKLSNDKGTWYVAKTPGSVTVHRAYGDLSVICTREGYDVDAVDSASSSTKGMAFGNILFGGVIGAGVDVGTGAAYDYPTTITVDMECKEEASVKTMPGGNSASKIDQVVEAAMDGELMDDGQNKLKTCVELESMMEEAKTRPFTLAVLQQNYSDNCGAGQ